VLENAGKELSERLRLPLDRVLCNLPWGEESSVSVIVERSSESDIEAWQLLTEAQQKARHLWFANLNTPEEFAEAEKHLDALDT
jgi:molybdopterin-guanine dinucleotide biosynthesis protein A